jgi:hypothetical protein
MSLRVENQVGTWEQSYNQITAFNQPSNGTPLTTTLTTEQNQALSENFARIAANNEATKSEHVNAQTTVSSNQKVQTNNNTQTIQVVKKKKKGGFFSKIGRGFKKFFKSKIGKIITIAAGVAAACFIPGVGAFMLKAVTTVGKTLLTAGKAAFTFAKNGITNLSTKLGTNDFFKNSLDYVKQNYLSKEGIKNLAQKYAPDILQKFLSPQPQEPNR